MPIFPNALLTLTSKTCLLCHTSERIRPWFASTAMRHSIKKNHIVARGTEALARYGGPGWCACVLA